jgi:hypothetical protein
MNRKLKQPPNSLSRTCISSLKILSNLIFIYLQLDYNPISTLIHILSNVLNGLYSSIDLNINMCLILSEQIWVIRNYLTVIIDRFLPGTLRVWYYKRSPITSTSILRVAVFSNNRLCTKLLRKPLSTL